MLLTSAPGQTMATGEAHLRASRAGTTAPKTVCGAKKHQSESSQDWTVYPCKASSTLIPFPHTHSNLTHKHVSSFLTIQARRLRLGLPDTQRFQWSGQNAGLRGTYVRATRCAPKDASRPSLRVSLSAIALLPLAFQFPRDRPAHTDADRFCAALRQVLDHFLGRCEYAYPLKPSDASIYLTDAGALVTLPIP